MASPLLLSRTVTSSTLVETSSCHLSDSCPSPRLLVSRSPSQLADEADEAVLEAALVLLEEAVEASVLPEEAEVALAPPEADEADSELPEADEVDLVIEVDLVAEVVAEVVSVVDEAVEAATKLHCLPTTYSNQSYLAIFLVHRMYSLFY